MLNGPIHAEVVRALTNDLARSANDGRASALATLAADASEPPRRRLRCALRRARPAACPQPACQCG
jgi:hypothetical protein